MTCLECGKGTMHVKREKVAADQMLGLPGTWLLTNVARCDACGAYEVEIPNMEGLHRVVGRWLIAKPQRLVGVEIRFLRKLLGWSGVDFAAHMGTQPETVSRWENDSTPIGPQADRLLRMMARTLDPVADYRKLDLLKTVAKAKPAKTHLTMTANPKGWTVKSA